MIASDRLAADRLPTSVQLQLLRLLKLQLEVLLIWILVQLEDFIVDEQLLSLRHQQVKTASRSPLRCFQPDVIHQLHVMHAVFSCMQSQWGWSADRL